jgi:hypothetical protein
MSRFPIDVLKSKETGRLVIKVWLFEKITQYFVYSVFVIVFPVIAFLEFYFDLDKNESIVLSLLLLTLSLTISALLIYSIVKVNSLKRINGLSRGKNSILIKKIAESNNWNISSSNQQITIIDFSWQDVGTDWGKQMTILYDENDILVNCISFGLNSIPSPFHWFANKRKVNKLKVEFENRIQNI